MKTFILVFLSLITSSVYARSNFCPEVELSKEQKVQIQEHRQAAWAEFQTLILDTVPASEEQQALLAKCFENKKRGFCPKAELSEEQKTQIKELRKNLKASSDDDMSRKEKKAVWAELWQNILDTVPTSEEQQVALTECFKDRKKHWKKHRKFCPEAELSKEQKKKIREERKAIRTELQSYILDTVSASEEQKAILSAYFECKTERRKRGKRGEKHKRD